MAGAERLGAGGEMAIAIWVVGVLYLGALWRKR